MAARTELDSRPLWLCVSTKGTADVRIASDDTCSGTNESSWRPSFDAWQKKLIVHIQCIHEYILLRHRTTEANLLMRGANIPWTTVPAAIIPWPQRETLLKKSHASSS